MRQLSRFQQSPENVDRVLVGGCVVIWLAVIGTGVAAVVALVDKASGHSSHAESGGAPWLLYVVIAISAVIILGAIPLLLRARRVAAGEPPRAPAAPAPVKRTVPQGVSAPSATGTEALTEKLRVFGTHADALAREPLPRGSSTQPAPLPLPADEVERMWLRVAASIVAAMGVATLAVAVATYFMGVDANNGALSALIIAGIVTVLMPAIPWLWLRQLRARIAAAD